MSPGRRRLLVVVCPVILVLAVGFVFRQMRRATLPVAASIPAVVRSQPGLETSRTFYLDPAGDDARTGRGPGEAWKSLERASQETFRPGDRVLLRAGGRFEGTLSFGADDRGTPFRPIVVGVYGTGRATVVAGAGPGLTIRDTAGIRVSSLDLVGGGPTNRSPGVVVENGLPGDQRLTHVVLRDLDVGGFGKEGIRVFGLQGRSGFSDVLIEGCRTHDNTLAGIYVGGTFEPHLTGFCHADVVIRGCTALRNLGDPKAKEHTGSGIVVSETEEARIEGCEAAGNGAASVSKIGGPVGIWGWHCDRLVIQNCVSHHNRTGGRKDGGGFDLDGGCTNSVLQRNLSYANDGAGYLLAQFPGARPFYNNVVRHNVSIDDGRRNGYGGIMAWAQVAQTQIVHNTVVMTRSADGAACGVLLREVEALNLDFANNLVCVADGVPAVRCDMSPRPGSVRFAGNVYVSPKASRFEWQGKSVDGIAAWRSVFGQERGSGRNLGGEARAPVASASSSPQAPDLTVAIPTSASIEALRRSAALNLAGEFGVDLPTGKIGADPRMGRRP